MEEYKYRLFAEEYGRDFSEINALTGIEAERLIAELNMADETMFYENLMEKGEVVYLNEDEDIAWLHQYLKPDDLVHLVWSSDQIDTILFSDLVKYWDTIWYGPGDETLALYACHNQLTILITHWQTAYLYKAPGSGK